MKRYQRRIARLLATLTGTIVFSLILPSLAFAEETAEAGHESGGVGPSLLLPNMGEFIPMLVCFIILMLVLAKFGWPTIIGTLEGRVERIRNDLESAEESRTETAKLLEEQRTLLNEARSEATQIINDARAAAEANRLETEAQASRQAEALLARARETIEHDKNQAMLELRSSLADLTVTLAGRLIGNDLDDSEHRKIIEYYVEQAGELDYASPTTVVDISTQAGSVDVS